MRVRCRRLLTAAAAAAPSPSCTRPLSSSPSPPPLLKLLRLSRFPIFNQLVLEEALLRNTSDNWCIVNNGAFSPAIVLGISGRPEELIHVQRAIDARVQVIKRFTGGGTVVVDEDTIFATLVIQGQQLPHVEPFPKSIMQWTERFYSSVFEQYGAFKLRENDYVFQQRKFGGNAQAITGRRWLHHTSFLWDYRPGAMALLQQPPRAPDYRSGRGHEEFVVRLREQVPSREALVQGMCGAAQLAGFQVQEATLGEAALALSGNKMCGTKLVDLTQHLPPAP